MGRPKNTELINLIHSTSWELFHEVGYRETSYSQIAEKLEISKGLVQYHVAHKEELAISLMKHVLQISIEKLEKSKNISGFGTNAFNDLYLIGQAYFEHLLDGDAYKTFLIDILRSRDLTEGVLAFNMEWAFTYIKQQQPEMIPDTITPAILQSVVTYMGGFYEWMYFCLKNNVSLDIPATLYPVIFNLMIEFGIGEQESRIILSNRSK